MAKTDEIKFIDQHLEKVVLGVCVLVMAYGVFQWVVSAPRRAEVPRVENGRRVPADEVDQELLNWAEGLTRRTPKDSGFGTPVPDYSTGIITGRNPVGIAAIDNWGNHRQIMVQPKRVKRPEGPRLNKIGEILLTFSPKFTEIKGARELVNKDDGIDKLVFRGKAEFPVGALLKAWNKELRGSAMDEVRTTSLAVEIEKRVVLSDGAFGPATRVARVKIEEANPIPDVVIPPYTGKNADAVRKAIEEFSLRNQNRILRPPYWQVWSQGQQKWATPWIKEEILERESAPARRGSAPAARPVRGRVARGARAARAGVAPAPVVQIDDGKLELWFHDNDVIVQEGYSYRMRIVFVNPLFTYDDIVYKGTPKDAYVQSIGSGWSDWVQAGAIPRTTQYFVTSAQGMGGKQRLYCTVFTRSLGQVVDHKFAVLPGRVIGGMVSKQIKNPTTGKIVLKSVDFSTNAVVVQIDFSRKFVNRMGNVSETRELTCLEGGKLASQILVKDMPAEDVRSKTFKGLQALVDAQAP